MHNFSSKQVNILNEYANKIPVIIIARLLGVPEEISEQLLRWSNDMVMMYQARRTEEHEERAVKASNAKEIFSIANVNGALVGGASLKSRDFIEIITAASNSE